MKSLILKPAILAVAALVLLPVTAAAQPTAMHFTVPFEFSNGDRYLVAGDYIVRWDALTGFIALERKGGEALFLPPGIAGTSPKLETRGKMVFHQYGSRYYLRGVVRPGTIRCEWPASKAERQLARTLSPVEVALVVR